MNRFHCVILAGGSGNRIGGRPKQLRDLGGIPVLLHSIRALRAWPRTSQLVVVGAASFLEEIRILLGESAPGVDALVEGGATRHESQLNGIRAVLSRADQSDIIVIHDAARPFIDPEELNRIDECFDRYADVDIVSLAGASSDTIAEADPSTGRLSAIHPRDRIFAVKTPQAVRARILPDLMKIPDDPSLTDLLSWGRAAGLACSVVPAGPFNIKITQPEDFPLAESILSIRKSR